MPTHASPKSNLIRGALWTVGMRWTVKGLGFVSTVIMARLLLPADYGIVAMAMLVVGFIQAFIDFNASTALLRKAEVSRDEVDSAWTLRLMEGCCVGLLMLAISSIAASYFKEPKVQPVLWVLAVCVALASANSMSQILAQKSFDFYFEFRLNVICKVLALVTTVASGYLLRDYRALLIGVATGYVSGFLMSYAMHPYRPRWNTTKIAEIWAVTKWLMLAGAGGFILRKGDELAAAHIAGTAEFGLYNVGSDLGQMPTAEVGPAMLKAFLPVLASTQGNTGEINSAVLKTVSAMNAVTIPIGLGFAALAGPATALILGPAWASAAQYVAAFSIVGMLQTMFGPLNTLLLLRGHTRTQNRIVWLEFLVFLMAAVVLVPGFYLMGLVWARVGGNVANLLVTALAVRRHCAMPLRSVARAVIRPLFCGITMYFTVAMVAGHVQGESARLFAGVLCGVGVFAFLTTVSWYATGKPQGLESTLIDAAKRRMNR